MKEPADDHLKNFALLMPKTAILLFNGCTISGGTGKEYKDFKEWFEKQRYQQLSLGEMKVDIWIRHNDLIVDHVGYSMQNLFNNWKTDPPKEVGYSFRSFSIKTG